MPAFVVGASGNDRDAYVGASPDPGGALRDRGAVAADRKAFYPQVSLGLSNDTETSPLPV
jgi:hypothetical protein